MDLSLLQYTSQQRYKCKYKYIKRRFKTNINNICKNRRNYGDSLWRISKTYLKYAKFYEAGTPRLQSWEVQDAILAKIDINNTELDEQINFTFHGCDILEKFNEYKGE